MLFAKKIKEKQHWEDRKKNIEEPYQIYNNVLR